MFSNICLSLLKIIAVSVINIPTSIVTHVAREKTKYIYIYIYINIIYIQDKCIMICDTTVNHNVISFIKEQCDSSPFFMWLPIK